MSTSRIWDWTLDEFTEAALRGRLIKGTGQCTPEDLAAKTSLRRGEINGYSDDDIAHFYCCINRDALIGYAKMLQDAVTEGRGPIARWNRRPQPPRMRPGKSGQRLSRWAKAAATRKFCKRIRIAKAVRRLAAGERLGPQKFCVICRLVLGNARSITAGYGPECAANVLKALKAP